MSSFLLLLLQLFCFLLAKQKLRQQQHVVTNRAYSPLVYSRDWVCCLLPWGSILRRITLPFNLRNKVKLSRKQSLWPKSQRNAQRDANDFASSTAAVAIGGNISLDTRHATKSSAEFPRFASPTAFCSATPISRSQGNRNSCTLRRRLTFSSSADCSPQERLS